MVAGGIILVCVVLSGAGVALIVSNWKANSASSNNPSENSKTEKREIPKQSEEANNQKPPKTEQVSEPSLVEQTFQPAPAPPPPPPPTPQLYEVVIVNETFAVAPGTYHYFKWNVGPLINEPRIVGRFVAQGGSGNDIEVYITDVDGFTNYKNRNTFRLWYDSGSVTVGNIDVRVPRGDIYIIFDNRDSIFSNKVVQASLKIQYWW
jgi:hypothetical protein